MAGASDWFNLHRKFAEYAVSNDTFVLELRRYFDYSLLSAESFFHVLALNSEFCWNFVATDLRLARWIRARGCHCQVGERGTVFW